MRYYTLTLQSAAVPVGFKVVTIPMTDNVVTDNQEQVLESLGLTIDQTFFEESQAAARLSNLVAFTLWNGRKPGAREIERVYGERAAEFRQFMEWAAEQSMVPVESSPLHGTSLNSLMKASSLMGFASFSEGYGLVHHDPIICIVAFPMTVLIGATVGTGEALQERIRRALGADKKKRKKRDK